MIDHLHLPHAVPGMGLVEDIRGGPKSSHF